MVTFGIDSFAAINDLSADQAMGELLDRIVAADSLGFDVFGIGEHHRAEFLDAAPAVILAAAAARTKNIRLTSAVTVLSAADPVRVFQQYATLDLISKGRAEMVVGRGSFGEAFPLFGYSLDDYDTLFNEKLDLLLACRASETVHWSGTWRPALNGVGVYPRPLQKKLPIWIGMGGSVASAQRAGRLGLPLMIAIIGGETRRFKRHVDAYKAAGLAAGFSDNDLSVGVHALAYVAETDAQAKADFLPGYIKVFTRIGKERGWGPVTESQFDHYASLEGALLVGSPETVLKKIAVHSAHLGGVSRWTFQMNVAALTQQQLLASMENIAQYIIKA